MNRLFIIAIKKFFHKYFRTTERTQDLKRYNRFKYIYDKFATKIRKCKFNDCCYAEQPKKYTKIIPTGGVTHPNKYHSEAFYMKQRLIRKGIKPNKIHIENRALSTIENAKYTKKLVGGNKIVVVTSKNHYKRAKKIFDRIYGKNIKFFSSS